MRLAGVFATAALALAPDFASAASPYLASEGQWTIFPLGMTRCVAVNRPPEENNASPYDALWLSRKVGQEGTELDVFYWPGAFLAGDTTTLTITFDGGPLLTYPATAVDEYVVKIDALLSDDDIATLGRSQMTSVAAKGLAKGTLFFITDKVPAVSAKLTECVKTLPPK